MSEGPAVARAAGLFSVGLFGLELRRAALGVLLPGAVFMALVLRLRPGPARSALSELAAGPVARGLFRQDLWTAVLLVLLPLAAYQAARVPARWRAGEADWIGARPVARGAAIRASWSGLALALLAALGLACLWIESRAGHTGTGAGNATPVLVGSSPLDRVHGIEPGATLELTLDAKRVAAASARSGSAPMHARMQLTVLPGGDPTGRARASVRSGARTGARTGARSGDAPASRRAQTLVDGRTWLEVELPAVDGAVTLALESTGGARLALLDQPGIELWRSGGTEGHASLAVAKRAALALACTSSLAFAFATWIGSLTAAATALALWFAWALFAAGPLSPGLSRALGIVGQGRLPGSLGAGALVLTVAILLTSHLIAARGLRSWRYVP